MMIKYRTVFECLVAFSLSQAAFHASAAENITVLPGTEVQLALSQMMSSQTAYKNQNFRLAVAEDVRVHGQVVIPKGTEAIGIVIRADGNGPFGKPGTLHLRIQSLLLNGRRIPLYSSMGKKGKDGDAGVVWLSAFFGPIGGLVQGRKVEIPAGTPLLAYIDQAFEVSMIAAGTAADSAPVAPAPASPAAPDVFSVSAADAPASGAVAVEPSQLHSTDRNDDVQKPTHD